MKPKSGYDRTKDEVKELKKMGGSFSLKSSIPDAEVRYLLMDSRDEGRPHPKWWLLLSEVAEEVVRGCRAARITKSPLWAREDLMQQCIVDCIGIYNEFPPSVFPKSDLIYLKIRNSFRRCCSRVISRDSRRFKKHRALDDLAKERCPGRSRTSIDELT